MVDPAALQAEAPPFTAADAKPTPEGSVVVKDAEVAESLSVRVR